MRVVKLLIAGVGLSLPAHAAARQTEVPVVESVILTADLMAGDGSATVRVEYLLSGRAPATGIPIQLLGFDAATSDEVRVGGLDPVVLWPATGARRVATVPSGQLDEAQLDRLILEYDVSEAVEESGDAFVVRVPLVVATLPLRDGVDDLFRASVRLPASWRVVDAFPSGLRIEGDVYSVAMSTVPSVLRLHGRSDGRWRPGLPLMIDLLIVSMLVVFAFVGWRHLRRVAA